MASAIRIANPCLLPLQRTPRMCKDFEVSVGSKWEHQGSCLDSGVNTLLPAIAKSQTSQNCRVCWEVVWQEPDLTCSHLSWRQTR